MLSLKNLNFDLCLIPHKNLYLSNDYYIKDTQDIQISLVNLSFVCLAHMEKEKKDKKVNLKHYCRESEVSYSLLM